MEQTKGAGDENFPVASWLLPRRTRRHVLVFYDLARSADDIADSPDLAPGEKIRRLDLLAGALVDPACDDPALLRARRLRESLAQTAVSPRHSLDLLEAFRQDARVSRYHAWDDLIGYCNLSAAPVGRYLLDLHGETQEARGASDALCNALQVLNHLQDCQQDYRILDRVYLPLEWFSLAGTGVDALDRERSDPSMRRILDMCLDATGDLLAAAAPLAKLLRGTRLSAEAAVIVAVANRLRDELARRDPLAGRVVLSRVQYAACFLKGIAGTS